MDRLFTDSEWVRIDDELDSNGAAGVPVYSRNIRSSGGMIVGRVVRIHLSKYRLEMYVKGIFKDMGTYASFETAIRSLDALMPDSTG